MNNILNDTYYPVDLVWGTYIKVDSLKASTRENEEKTST